MEFLLVLREDMWGRWCGLLVLCEGVRQEKSHDSGNFGNGGVIQGGEKGLVLGARQEQRRYTMVGLWGYRRRWVIQSQE